MPRGVTEQAVCGAKKRQGEGTCRRTAGWGTDHVGHGCCKFHGGATPNHKKKAAVEIVDAEVKKILTLENVEPLGDPITQLQVLAGEAIRIKDIFAQKVTELEEWSYKNGEATEDVRAVVAGLERGMDRAHRIVLSMAKLDLETRLVKLSEAQAELLRYVVERVLNSKELALDKERRQMGRTILARELTAVTSATSSAA